MAWNMLIPTHNQTYMALPPTDHNRLDSYLRIAGHTSHELQLFTEWTARIETEIKLHKEELQVERFKRDKPYLVGREPGDQEARGKEQAQHDLEKVYVSLVHIDIAVETNRRGT